MWEKYDWKFASNDSIPFFICADVQTHPENFFVFSFFITQYL